MSSGVVPSVMIPQQLLDDAGFGQRQDVVDPVRTRGCPFPSYAESPYRMMLPMLTYLTLLHSCQYGS
jgi:hypothetical protein